MKVSDVIEKFIAELLDDLGGSAELQRAELANRFNCVPSQINYVISTRFSPEHGYVVESRRGGGGYIRISRVEMDAERLIMHTVNAIGFAIDNNSALALVGNLRQSNAISSQEAKLISAAISPNALRAAEIQTRNVLRAAILKQMLINKL